MTVLNIPVRIEFAHPPRQYERHLDQVDAVILQCDFADTEYVALVIHKDRLYTMALDNLRVKPEAFRNTQTQSPPQSTKEDTTNETPKSE